MGTCPFAGKLFLFFLLFFFLFFLSPSRTRTSLHPSGVASAQLTRWQGGKAARLALAPWFRAAASSSRHQPTHGWTHRAVRVAHRRKSEAGPPLREHSSFAEAAGGATDLGETGLWTLGLLSGTHHTEPKHCCMHSIRNTYSGGCPKTGRSEHTAWCGGSDCMRTQALFARVWASPYCTVPTVVLSCQGPAKRPRTAMDCRTIFSPFFRLSPSLCIYFLSFSL